MTHGLRVLVALSLVACTVPPTPLPTAPSAHAPPVQQLSGLLVFDAEAIGARLRWLDLASGAGGELEYQRGGNAVAYTAKRDAVWLMVSAMLAGTEGTLRVTRKDTAIATLHDAQTTVQPSPPMAGERWSVSRRSACSGRCSWPTSSAPS